MSFKQLDRLALEAGIADNDNQKKPESEEIEWSPRRVETPRGTPFIRLGDGPSPEQFIASGLAWYAGEPRQAANDNWPLAKVLRRDGLDHCLSLAERYRDVFDRARSPIDLIGHDLGDDIFLMHRTDLDASTGDLKDKGPKRVTGKRHPEPNSVPRHGLRTDPDQPMQRARKVPKVWNGDWPILDRMDSVNELAALRVELGWLAEPFEAAVVDGETLESIGLREGAGQGGAGGAGRVLVMRGMKAVDHYWSGRRQAA
jgi:hypothetical protein